MDCEGLATELEDTSGLDQEIEATQKEIDSVIEQNRRLIREQAVTGMPTEEFDERTATLNERYKAADEKLTRLKAEREDHLTRGKGIRRFLSALDDQAQRLEDWDEQAWNLLVSRVIIQKDGSAEFIQTVIFFVWRRAAFLLPYGKKRTRIRKNPLPYGTGLQVYGTGSLPYDTRLQAYDACSPYTSNP